MRSKSNPLLRQSLALSGSLSLTVSAALADTVYSSVDLRILSNGAVDPTTLSLYNDGGNIQRSFLQFDLSSYSGKSITSDATLTLVGGIYGDSLTGVSIGTANSSWIAGTINWSTQPALTAIPGATNPSGTFGSGDVNWTIPWYMLEKMATTGSGYNNGIGITAGIGSTQHFYSSTAEGTGNDPRLTFSAATAAGSTWSGGNGNWTDTANWAGGTVAEGIGQAATISGGSAVNITMDANRSVGSLSFSGADHTISGAGKLALNVVSGSPTIAVGATRTATISAALVGLDGLTKTDAGTLVLSGANSYTGTTTINAGTLLATNNTALGAGGHNGSTMTFINDGATLALQGGISLDEHFHIYGSGVGGLGALRSISGNNALTNTNGGAAGYAIRSNTVVGVDAGTLSVSGFYEEGGSYNLTKVGAGTLALTVASSYSGGTTVSGGTLALQSTYASSGFAINSGAALELNVASGSRDLSSTTFSGTGTLTKTGGGSVGWGASSATFALGAGSLIDVQQGTFGGGSNANENWTNNLAGLNVASGATFNGVEANVRVDALTGAGTITSGFPGAGYANFTFGVNNGSGNFSGTLSDSDSAPANFVKAGSGTQTLSGTNTYTGTTTVSAGKISLAAAGSLPTAGRVSMAAGGILSNDAAAGTSFNLGALTLTGGELAATSSPDTSLGNFHLSGDVTVSGSVRSTISADVRVTSNQTRDFNVGSTGDASGVDLLITGKLGHQNNVAWGYATKSGEGTMKLSGINELGSMTVNAGRLILEDTATGWGHQAGGLTNNAELEYSVTSGSGGNNGSHGGSGNLSKTGAGTLTLSGGLNYSGTTTIAGGTLNMQGSGGGGTNYNGGNIHIHGASTLRVSGPRYNFNGETFTFNSVGGGTIDAIASGAGGFVFTGNNSFVTSGGAQNIISGTKNVFGNEGLNLNGSNATFEVVTGSDAISDLKVIGTIWNGGNVTKNGAGRMEISAPQGYTGNTTVNEGTLILGDGSNNVGLSDSYDLVVASGATLQLNYDAGNPDTIDELSLGGVLVSPGTYNAANSDGFITGTGSLIVQNGPIADPFANWMATNYPTLVSPDNQPAADPDDDGIENLIEYVLEGGDPSVSSADILPTLDASGANFVFTYLRRAAATGTTQIFQYGTDLSGWTDVAIPGGAGVVVTGLGGIDEVEITVAKGVNSKLFGRLQVTAP